MKTRFYILGSTTTLNFKLCQGCLADNQYISTLYISTIAETDKDNKDGDISF